jgi:hypothetical protein
MEATGYRLSFTITHSTGGKPLAKPHSGTQVMCKDCYHALTIDELEKNSIAVMETFTGDEDVYIRCLDCGMMVSEML